MRVIATSIACLLTLAGGGSAYAESAGPIAALVAEAAPAAAASGWIARAEDNICGLKDPRTLSNPAKVKYDVLYEATPEIKKLRKEGIDPNSPEGIQLRQKAKERVTRACESVMKEKGYCSVWKAIRHKDGRKVPDITQTVKGRL